MAFQNRFAPSFELESSSDLVLHRKPVNENIINRLKARETHIRPGGTGWYQQRTFYQSVFPNLTVVNADKPPGYLKKFTPDGKYLLSFSTDLNFVEIYEYQGCQAGEELLSTVEDNLLDGTRDIRDIRMWSLAKEKLFSKFFKIKHRVTVTSANHYLNREFCMFTDDSKYLLVVSIAVQHHDNFSMLESFSNNESLTPSTPFEDYTLHCIDVRAGVRTSLHHFRNDKIFTIRNQGIFIHQNIISVLSIQHQVIYIFKLHEGILIQTHKIGRFACSDDHMLFTDVFPQISDFHDFYREKTYCVLKNKLLIALYKNAVERGQAGISKFFQHFQFLEDLKMWKVQLIDERTLLVKYASQNVVTMRVQEPSTLPSFFLFYDFESGEVLSVHENTSSELLGIFQAHPGLFYQSEVHRGNLQAASYDIYSYKVLKRFKETIMNAKYGGEMEARKRILAQLPMQSQILNPSPYLDLSLFSYDDKYISSVERPKTCGDYPIRFYSRKSGLLSFEIVAGNTATAGRKLVSFVFHPSEPFAMSMKRNQDNHMISFHFRHLPQCSS